MHTLSRQVRFSIDPFSDEQQMGDNSYASKPCGQGFGIYLSLWVDLSAELDSDTGFVVNVSRIDQVVRQDVVPLFAAAFQTAHKNHQVQTPGSLMLLLRRYRNI